MKVIEKNRLSVSGELQDSVFFGIKQDGFAHIFNVLRNQLYSDKILAVIREYSANAYDAHVECGNDELPFEVTLPNRFDSFFKVRDFGRGLTQEDVRDIYANYGESTKRHSNDYIGQLGLGSKSAFAYADSFTITSYNGGFKYVYNAFIDETDLGKIVLLDSGETDEADGIEISVPVDGYDVDSFKRKAEQLYKYYEVKPTIKGQTLNFEDSGKVILNGEDWKIRSEGNGAVAVMGNIGYPLDTEALGIEYRSKDKLWELCNINGLEIYFKIGDLEMSASREGLQYTKHTKRNLIQRLKNLKVDIVKKVAERFKGCESHFQAKCLYNDLFDMTNDLYHIRQIVAEDLKFKNLKIESSNYYLPDEVGTVYTIGKTYRSAKWKAQTTTKIEATSNTVVIKNDIGNNRALLGRLLPMMIEENKKPFVYSFKDEKLEKEYVKKESFDPEDVILLSSLPKFKMSDLAEKYGNSDYENKQYIPRLSTNGSGGYVRTTKHTSKSFKIKWDEVKGGWHRNASEYWDDVDVDLENDNGIYVMIDRFKIVDDNHYANGRANCFGNFQACFKDVGIDVPDVYGFKPPMRTKVEAAEGWTEFFTWAKAKFDSCIEDNGIMQTWKDYNAYENETSHWQHEALYDMDGKDILKLKHKLKKKDNTLITFLQKVKGVQKNANEVNDYLKLMRALNLERDENYKKENLKGGYDFKTHLNKVFTTYPLVQYIEKQYIKNGSEDEFVKELAHYVNLIDNMSIEVE